MVSHQDDLFRTLYHGKQAFGFDRLRGFVDEDVCEVEICESAVCGGDAGGAYHLSVFDDVLLSLLSELLELYLVFIGQGFFVIDYLEIFFKFLESLFL